MLKHWSYRTLNLEGQITIIKSLALPKLTYLATVLPEHDNQKAKKLKDLTNNFIWKRFKEQKKKVSVRVNFQRAKIKPGRTRNNRHCSILDGWKIWMAEKDPSKGLQ